MSSQKRPYELKARAESQRRNRARIAAAAAELHQEQGVAKTTVADIARRAGVQRLTVYNHFANLSELLPACSAHYRGQHPQPNFEEALALEDPAARVRAVLRGLYGWYRDNERMMLNVHGERGAVPELDAWMIQSADRQLAERTLTLARGFRRKGTRATRLRAVIALSLDFWTWRRLAREGLNDDAAADMMTGLVTHI
jgi:AcrR family transcriptional regulator